MKNDLQKSTKLALAIAAMVSSVAVTAEPRAIEEIVVTSVKRGAASLGETSFTINVIGGDDLKNRQITNPEDLRTAVSGVYIDEGSSTPRVAIRGVGFDNFQIQAENGVTTYIDGVVVQRTHAVLGTFLDLQQVEVLKGPQGSAFGRNATGGSINLITAKPEDGFSGEVGAGIGSFDRRKISGHVNYGGDTFGVRVSGLVDQDDGYVTNIVTGNDELQNKDNQAARLALSWTPTDDLSVDYSYSYTKGEGNGPAFAYTTEASATAALNTGLFLGLTPLTTSSGRAITTEDLMVSEGYTVANSIDARTERESKMQVLNIELELGWGTLRSITGHIDFESLFSADVGAPSHFEEGLSRTNYNLVESDQFSQEFLLSGSTDSLDWVTGVYYLEEEASDESFIAAALVALDPNLSPFVTVPGNFFLVQEGGGQKLTSYAIFADGQYTLSDTLRFNAGLRWTEDEKEAFGVGNGFFESGTPFVIPGSSLDGVSVKEDVITWQTGLEYDFSDAIFGYARIAKGYKGGGINNGLATEYQPEELISYELGLKGDLADNLSFSLAAFTSDYEDIQLFVPDSGLPNVINAASATISGIDIETTWNATDAFSIDAQVTWLVEAEYEHFVTVDPLTNVELDFSGTQLTRSPEFTGVVGANYFVSLSDNVDLTVRAEAFVTSEVIFSHLAKVREEALTQDGYALFNLYVTANIGDNLDVRLYGKNLTDEYYLTTITEGIPGFAYGGYGRPQEFGLDVTYRFGE